MAFNKRNNELNMEQVAAFLKDAVSKVENNPELYEELKKVFKKNVPLTRRSYVAAYLLKCASGAIFHFNPNKPARGERNDRRDEKRRNRYEERNNRSDNNETAEPKERFQAVEIDPANLATVFVSIGRNRRVFPRDLLGLFINEAGLDHDRIGHIKVLASYSFVDLYKEDADKAIAALNGFNYRGRALNVDYASKKDEAAPAEEAPAEEYINNERVPDVENTSAPIADSFTTSNADTVAQQAAFAKEMEKAPVELSDEEILAMRAPRSSSTADIQ